MLKPTLKPFTAAALLMLLTGCATKPARLALDPKKATAEKQIARICPRPISPENMLRIADELEAAIKAGVPPDLTATELERLNDGAKACRGAK